MAWTHEQCFHNGILSDDIYLLENMYIKKKLYMKTKGALHTICFIFSKFASIKSTLNNS